MTQKVRDEARQEAMVRRDEAIKVFQAMRPRQEQPLSHQRALSRSSLVCPAPCYHCSLCFHSWVAESVQVPAGVRNGGLMSSTTRGPWRRVQEAPSPLPVGYVFLFGHM